MIYYIIMFVVIALLMIVYLISCRYSDKQCSEMMYFMDHSHMTYAELSEKDFDAGIMRGDIYY